MPRNSTSKTTRVKSRTPEKNEIFGGNDGQNDGQNEEPTPTTRDQNEGRKGKGKGKGKASSKSDMIENFITRLSSSNLSNANIRNIEKEMSNKLSPENIQKIKNIVSTKAEKKKRMEYLKNTMRKASKFLSPNNTNISRLPYVLSRAGFIEERDYLFIYDTLYLKNEKKIAKEKLNKNLNFNRLEKEYKNFLNKHRYFRPFSGRVLIAKLKNNFNPQFGVVTEDKIKEQKNTIEKVQQTLTALENLQKKRKNSELNFEKQMLEKLDFIIKSYKNKKEGYVPYAEESIASRFEYMKIWLKKEKRKRFQPLKTKNRMELVFN